tara:strand:- start:49599 stop:50330 length:732 start_codon:yes stop_codon:yes gene_type:complete
MIDTSKRSITKAITWKSLGFFIISLLSYAATKSVEKTFFVALTYHFIMLCLFIIHEKLWNFIKWGKTSGLFIQMTGLSGAGKTTLASLVSKSLSKKGILVEVIDGDEYRKELCEDLGFSKKDRQENIKRLSFVGKVLGRNNVVCIMSAINPYNSTRDKIKKSVPDSRLVYIKCSLDEVIKRDVKGLYKRALLPKNHEDHIPNFTGISDPFEEPTQSDLVLQTDELSLKQAAAKLEKYILKQIK